MSTVQELRERGVESEPQGSSGFSLLITLVGAFAVGGLIVLAWTMSPRLSALASSMFKSGPSLDFGSGRVGDAERAPLLKACIPRQAFDMGGSVPSLEVTQIYRILRGGSTLSTFSAMASQGQNVVDPLAFALMWGQVADCVFHQNGRTLCEPDNRALAVDAIGNFLRQFAIAANHVGPDNSFTQVMATVRGDKYMRVRRMQQGHNFKDRVLSSLRSQLQQGRLIAGDFGYFVSGEIGKMVGEITPQRNACADEKA